MYIPNNNLQELNFQELSLVDKNLRSEFHMQLVLVEFLEKNNIFYHTPINELYGRVRQYLSEQEYNKFLKIGFKRGASDLIILEPTNKYKCLCLELKYKRGKITASQEVFLTESNNYGACAKWVNTLTDATSLIHNYLYGKSIPDGLRYQHN